MEGGAVGHNFEMGLPKVYIGWKQNFTEKPGIYVKLFLAM